MNRPSWTCRVCTFAGNNIISTVCEICGKSRMQSLSMISPVVNDVNDKNEEKYEQHNDAVNIIDNKPNNSSGCGTSRKRFRASGDSGGNTKKVKKRKLNDNNNSSDETNNNKSLEWNCSKCTFSNQHNAISCSMCDESRFSTIQKNTVLSLNKNKLTETQNDSNPSHNPVAKTGNNTLETEILQNEKEWKKYVQKHGDATPTRPRQHCYSNRNQDKRNDNNGEKNNENNKNNNNNDSNGEDDEKKDKNKQNDGEEEQIIGKLRTRMEQVKQHPKWTQMLGENKLTDDELMAIVYYCDDSGACWKMKEAYRTNEQTFESLDHLKKWELTYYHATNTMNKIHKVFHFQNEQFKRYYQGNRRTWLFHGSTIKALDTFSQTQLNLTTLTSFTGNLGVAKGFTYDSGLVLVINNAYKAVYDGTLKGGDVRWISKWEEDEFIIMPAKYNGFRRMSKTETEGTYKWIINSDQQNVYICKHYKFNPPLNDKFSKITKQT